jgi:molybdate transport system ATP-binding protein
LTGLAERYPHQISGGQQQRVALARAVARRPRLLLLDEPLSALDSALRDEMRTQLRRHLGDFGIPVVLVTHDRTEAIALADQIVVMESGRVRQSGSVHDVFTHPADLNVARIIGIETVQPGEIVGVEEGLASVSVAGVRLVAVAPAENCRNVHVCIRGEDVTLQRQRPGETSARNHLHAVIKWLTPEGALVRIGLDCGFELTALVTRPACAELDLKVGEQVTALIKAPAIHLMPSSGTLAPK